jgi:hypothetical protein
MGENIFDVYHLEFEKFEEVLEAVIDVYLYVVEIDEELKILDQLKT